MGSICIDVDGIVLATVDLMTVDVFHTYVHGALYDEVPASIDASGGMYEGVHEGRTWINDRTLRPGELLTVRMLDGCTNPQPGLTFAQLFPDNPIMEDFDFTATEEMNQELRARPLVRKSFSLRTDISTGLTCETRNDHGHDSFSFSVNWHHYSPAQARVYVRTSSRESIIRRGGGCCHLQTRIGVGESASFFMRS